MRSQASVVAKREATTILQRESREVFSSRHLACLWQPLATRCHPRPLLPFLPGLLADLPLEAIRAEQSSAGASSYDFLMPPSEELLHRADSAGARLTQAERGCKFLCLANSCPLFDAHAGIILAAGVPLW